MTLHPGTLSKIDNLLAAAGTDKSKLLSAQIWVKDISTHFKPMNKVWCEWLDPSAKPVRATVEANLALPSLLVEIQVSRKLLKAYVPIARHIHVEMFCILPSFWNTNAHHSFTKRTFCYLQFRSLQRFRVFFLKLSRIVALRRLNVQQNKFA